MKINDFFNLSPESQMLILINRDHMNNEFIIVTPFYFQIEKSPESFALAHRFIHTNPGITWV